MQMQRENNERSTIIRTVFFQQQDSNKAKYQQEVELQVRSEAAAEEQQLLTNSHRQRFEKEYQRLRKICQKIKNDIQEEEANFPILDQKPWKSKFKTLHELTSATDIFLEQVVERGCFYQDDKDKLKLLSDDLEATSNLLESPSEKTMGVFQKRINDTEASTFTKVAYCMLGIGILVSLIAAAVLMFSVCVAPFFLAMSTFTTLFNISCITAMGGLVFSLITGTVASNSTNNQPINAQGKVVLNAVSTCMASSPSI